LLFAISEIMCSIVLDIMYIRTDGRRQYRTVTYRIELRVSRGFSWHLSIFGTIGKTIRFMKSHNPAKKTIVIFNAADV